MFCFCVIVLILVASGYTKNYFMSSRDRFIEWLKHFRKEGSISQGTYKYYYRRYNMFTLDFDLFLIDLPEEQVLLGDMRNEGYRIFAEKFNKKRVLYGRILLFSVVGGFVFLALFCAMTE